MEGQVRIGVRVKVRVGVGLRVRVGVGVRIRVGVRVRVGARVHRRCRYRWWYPRRRTPSPPGQGWGLG